MAYFRIPNGYGFIACDYAIAAENRDYIMQIWLVCYVQDLKFNKAYASPE